MDLPSLIRLNGPVHDDVDRCALEGVPSDLERQDEQTRYPRR